MNNCKGERAEEFGAAYVEGALDAQQAAEFEEHFFECSTCESYVIGLQQVAKQLRAHPVDATAAIERGTGLSRPWPVFLRPTLAWGLPIAALILIGVFAVRSSRNWAGSTDEAKNTRIQTPAVNTTGSSANTLSTVTAGNSSAKSSGTHKVFNTSQLADLTLPVFVAPNLRDGNSDARFVAGMQAYSAGDCSSAVEGLAHVPVNSNDARAARLFTGACQLKMGKVQSAVNNLHIVADAGDTPQLEWALYELAQAALATNDPSTAHSYLQKTIALRGDLEAKARTEDGKVTSLLDAEVKPAASTENK